MVRIAQTSTVEIGDIVDYRCTHCGHASKVGVMARGHAEVDVLYPNKQAADVAALVAELRAHKAIEEMVAVAKCPACHLRDGAAARRALFPRLWTSVGVGVVASIAGLAIAQSLDANPLIGMVVATIVVMAIAWVVLYRLALSRADGIAFLDPSG